MRSMNGKKQSAIETVLVKVVRHPVGRRDNGDTFIQQEPEQTAHDHRIGNVGDLHFIQAQKPQVAGQGLGYGHQCIVDIGLTRRVQPGLNLLHEGMEMDAARLGTTGNIVKQVHQHGFATTGHRPRCKGPLSGPVPV